MNEPSFDAFEQDSGVTFKNKDLLKQAFLHRSYLNEHRDIQLEHNERLEFLGDAVLELVVTEYLFSKYSDKTEGELTTYRAALVNTATLSAVAAELNVGDYLLLSRGEAKDTGRARQYILANTFEAIVGSLYLDQGYNTAQSFIARTIFPRIDTIVREGLWQDHKSRFQERAQEVTGITPSYQTVKEEGPDHDKNFTVGVFLGDVCVEQGTGNSKQEAEQDAARKALESKGW